ncbi:MAG: hypothetical protein M3Z96_14575 [Pseudomonadota bacterium]|nr:hypothetical protein [Pseudomonadota bacterium]
MNILELAARLLPGDLLKADDGLHRIMVIERHKDFVWLGCAKHRDFWLPNNLEVWIEVPVNPASVAESRPSASALSSCAPWPRPGGVR